MKGNYTQLNIEFGRNPRVSIIPISSDSPILEIFFNDSEGQDKENPRITILYYDETELSIDILASVKNNAASIGHPLILFAIRRWEEIVRVYYHRAIRRGDERCEIAKKHLERVGSALLVGSKQRAVSKETSFKYEVTKSSCIDLAWELLGKDDFKNIRKDGDKLIELANSLMNARVPPHPPIDTIGKKRVGHFRDPRIDILADICQVINFLKSKKGKAFLTRRRSRVVFRNAFDACRSGIDIGTVRKYKSIAMRNYVDQKEWFNPYFLVCNSITLSELLEADPLQLPLVVIPSDQDAFTVDRKKRR